MILLPAAGCPPETTAPRPEPEPTFFVHQFLPISPQQFQPLTSLGPVTPIFVCYTRIRRHQYLIPSIPSAPSSTPVTTRVTHRAKKCLPMRHPISPRRLNPLKKSALKPHDYEFHMPGTDASPRVTHLAKKCPPMRHKISPLYLNSLKNKRLKLDNYEFHIPGTDASPGAQPPPPAPRPLSLSPRLWQNSQRNLFAATQQSERRIRQCSNAMAE